jgi:hypothetical protein
MTPREEFLHDLALVFKKHHIVIDSDSQYDGEDNKCGDEYTLKGPGFEVNLTEIDDFFVVKWAGKVSEPSKNFQNVKLASDFIWQALLYVTDITERRELNELPVPVAQWLVSILTHNVPEQTIAAELRIALLEGGNHVEEPK